MVETVVLRVFDSYEVVGFLNDAMTERSRAGLVQKRGINVRRIVEIEQ
jgi:hypothetical protein